MSRRNVSGSQPPTNTNTRYMEVPHGNPFQNHVPGTSLRGPSDHLGLGPPPAANNTYLRASSLNTPTATNQAGFGRSTSLFHDADTPTQTNRHYHLPRADLYPAPRQAPSAASQLDRLVGMVQTLMQDNSDLKQDIRELRDDHPELSDRMASFEAGLSLPAPSRCSNPIRNQSRKPSTPARFRFWDSAIDPTLLDPAAGAADESSVDTDTDVTDCEPLDGLNLTPPREQRRSLSSVLPCQRKGLQSFIRTNPITHETYPALYFDFDVTAARNEALFRKVATQVLHEFQNKQAWPKVIRERSKSLPPPNWDLEVILKKQWLKANNNDAAAKALINSRNHRRTQRRVHSPPLMWWSHIATEYGLDPVVLKDKIHYEYLSDEVSGPEEETSESFEVWRYSDIIHDLEQRWYHTLTPKQKQNISYDRVSTNRTSPRIPIYAPYNFGFSEDWLKRDREKRDLLADWGKYSEPEDSGILAFIANRGAAIRGIES
ncbi:hypothetical protein B0H13DRAFT_1886818 [Mycena leptocephala]|nr:hypothetical protein B0H13DRAFT_1886818 [Mycena leptocephala]